MNEITGDYRVTGFPLGIALLGYLVTTNPNPTNDYIIFDRPWTPLELDKSHRVGELAMIGRNTPVQQMFGGNGLIFNFKATYKQADAHDQIIRLSGWVDNGEPLYFAVDRWIRKVVLHNFHFIMNKFNGWYDVELIMKKYEAIQPLKYLRAINDLAPTPVFPNESGSGSGSDTKPSNPMDPKNTGNKNSNYYEEKDSNGNLLFKVKLNKNNKIECRSVVVNNGDNILDIIKSYYQPAPTTNEALSYLYPIIMMVGGTRMNNSFTDSNNANYWTNVPSSGLVSGLSSPITLCFPAEIYITDSGKTFSVK